MAQPKQILGLVSLVVTWALTVAVGNLAFAAVAITTADGVGADATVIFGTEGDQWHWQDGGTVRIAASQLDVALALHDLTGFEGRCDRSSHEHGFAMTPIMVLGLRLIILSVSPSRRGEAAKQLSQYP